MQLSAKALRRLFRLAGLASAATLGVGLYGGVALADGPSPLTTQTPLHTGAITTPPTNRPAPTSSPGVAPAMQPRSGSGLVAAVAPTSAGIATAPAAAASATAGNATARAAVTAPAAASTGTCPMGGVAVHGYGCAGGGSALGVVSAPTMAHAAAAPAVSVSGGVGNVGVSTTAAAPTTAGAATCPAAGVAVHGYSCAGNGAGLAAVTAPTRAAIASAPTTTTSVNAGSVHIGNTASAPVTAAAATCPLVGVAVHGYGCATNGSALAVASAPGTVGAGAAPAATTGVSAGAAHVTNRTAALVNARAATCPLVGVIVRGYGCAGSGSALGVVSAPTRLAAGGAPTTSTGAQIAGIGLRDATSLPAPAQLSTCPLAGVLVHGYGCGTQGSGLAAVFAPTSLGAAATPVSTTHLTGPVTLSNATSLPLTASLSTCPLVGVAVRGYSCAANDSGLAVVTAPTALGTATNPTGTTHLGAGPASVSNAVTVPAAATLVTCPLIGIAVQGYGCAGPGSGLVVASAPTGAGVSLAPSSGAVTGLEGTTAGATISVPLSVGAETCPLIGVGVRGYECGSPGLPGAANGGSSNGGSGSGGSANGGTSGGPGTTSRPPAGTPSRPLSPAAGSGSHLAAVHLPIILASMVNGAGAGSGPGVGAGSGRPTRSSPPAGNLRPVRSSHPGTGRISASRTGRGAVVRSAVSRSPRRAPARQVRPALAGSRPGGTIPRLNGLPRTGGGDGTLPSAPSLPLLPALLALVLIGLGALLRTRSPLGR